VIAKGLAVALDNPQETDSNRLSSLGKTLAAFCRLLPNAPRTCLLALSNMLLTPVSEKEGEGEEQPYDRKLLAAVSAKLRREDLAEVLKYPSRRGNRKRLCSTSWRLTNGGRDARAHYKCAAVFVLFVENTAAKRLRSM